MSAMIHFRFDLVHCRPYGAVAVGVPAETHQRHHALREHAAARLRSAAKCAPAPGATGLLTFSQLSK